MVCGRLMLTHAEGVKNGPIEEESAKGNTK
jgi:hypothetical protein